MRRKINWAVAVLILVVTAVYLLDTLPTRDKRQHGRYEIAAIFKGLAIGMKQDEVEKLAASYPDLKVVKDSQYLTVESPMDIGPNWILTTQYDSGMGLVFARVRTAGPSSSRPSDAPEDLGKEL